MSVAPTRQQLAMTPIAPEQPNYGNSMMPMNTQYATATNCGLETKEMVTPSSWKK
jgi:hypothetical protein